MGFPAPALRRPEKHPDADSFIVFDGVSWEDYERTLAMRGDKSAPRITYLEGTLEIMAPGRSHENIKSLIGRLVEAWCFENDVRFTTLGSWTLKDKPSERGAEPDECYQIGEPDEERRPDLAIEVEWSHGAIDKLDLYRKLGVREIWSWGDGSLQPYLLRGERYRKTTKSHALPGIDLAVLAQFLDRPTTYDAVTGYRAALRRRTRARRR